MIILIVDDDDIKIKKITTVIIETLHSISHKILVAKNVASAMQVLIDSETVELLILDLNIPTRDGAEVKKMAGLSLLEEINRRSTICKPDFIMGLTAYKKEEISSKKKFSYEGWTLVHFNPQNADWEKFISNKLNYLIKKGQMATSTPKKEVILFVASSPIDQSLLNAGIEQRKIEEMLNSSTFRDKFDFISKPGAKLETLTGEMMKANPEYLHFTGHGDIDGLIMENDEGKAVLIPDLALKQLFELFTSVTKCVILSSCYSFEQAKIISTLGMYVIGMNDAVGVNAATEFAKGFYQAIGEGKDVVTSFRFGLVHLSANDIKQKSIPEIWFNGSKMFSL